MNLLFDLDGTITDPLPGIASCLRHALTSLGYEPRESRELARFVGPPLRGTFAELLSTNDQELISRAIALYRERFVKTGMFENRVYPNMAAGLERLIADGHRLWVVTSKPQVFAQQIVDHYELLSHFVAVYGSELDGRNTEKIDLIRVVLAKEGLKPDDTWMIGDRGLDVRGGRANGIRTAGVLWGYGSDEELRAEGPDVLIRGMSELIVHVRSRTEALHQPNGSLAKARSLVRR